MQDTQPSKTDKKPEKSPEVLATPATLGKPLPPMNETELLNLSESIGTTATTEKRSGQTSKSLGLQPLRLKASILAGDLGKFQDVEVVAADGSKSKPGIVSWRNGLASDPSRPEGHRKVVFLILGVQGHDLEFIETPDGLDAAIDGAVVAVESE